MLIINVSSLFLDLYLPPTLCCVQPLYYVFSTGSQCMHWRARRWISYHRSASTVFVTIIELLEKRMIIWVNSCVLAREKSVNTNHYIFISFLYDDILPVFWNAWLAADFIPVFSIRDIWSTRQCTSISSTTIHKWFQAW